jgi:proline dehydrogenase
MSFFDHLIAKTLPFVPKQIVGQVSKRYIAGTTFEAAVQVIRALNHKAMMATVDILGEHIAEKQAALQVRSEWESVIPRIPQEGLNSNISVKLTQLGLQIDPEFCYQNVRVLVEMAAQVKNFVRIDMEDSSTTDLTLEVYRRLRAEGYTNVGVVLQAYMRRSEADARALLATGGANVRLCKGIYKEPAAIAYQGKEEVRQNFMRLLEVLIGGGGYVGIATHDDALIDRSYQYLATHNVKWDRYEFQMLLGVKESKRNAIVADGHRLRVYVPFGEQWYAYSVRRLKENPQIAGYIVRALFSRNGS